MADALAALVDQLRPGRGAFGDRPKAALPA
jgi:hypothetical protein